MCSRGAKRTDQGARERPAEGGVRDGAALRHVREADHQQRSVQDLLPIRVPLRRGPRALQEGGHRGRARLTDETPHEGVELLVLPQGPSERLQIPRADYERIPPHAGPLVPAEPDRLLAPVVFQKMNPATAEAAS